VDFLKTVDIAVIGTGSLAQAIAGALSQTQGDSRRIAIIGRSPAKVSQIVSICNARAACFRSSSVFTPICIPEFKKRNFSRTLIPLKPRAVFCAASIQSPWEGSLGRNAWTNLIAEAGFGITLPLQLDLVAEVVTGLGDTKAAIVNASYPDCVNVVLQRTAGNIACGIGNAAIVEAFCLAHDAVRSQDVRIVGHHGHLGPWIRGRSAQHQPRIWVQGRERNSLQFGPRLGKYGEEMNQVTAATAVRLLLSLLSGDALQMSLPGVHGMRGGYPFIVKGGKFTLNLPPAITQAEAIAHNRKGERLDGIDLEAGVTFMRKARRALSATGFAYAEGFDFHEWPHVRDKMLVLRDRLRRVRD
jgi:hypothetical protein